MTNRHNAKIRFSLALLAILLISGAAFYAVSVPRHMGEAAAVGGVLDLTGADFDRLIYPLDGEWEFYFGRFYTPEDFAAGVPEGGTLIQAPSMWNDAGFPAEGFATYRLTVLTEEPMLMLRIPEIPDASAVRINSEKVFEAGVAGASRENTVSSVRSALVPFAAEGGRAEIILWAANYEWVGGGLSYSVEMGRPGVLQTDVVGRMVWFAVFLGIVLAMCLYHLILFLHRRKEKVYLIFAVMCLIVFARFAMETNGPVQFLLPGGLGKVLTRLYIALLPLHAAALVLFTHAVFRLPVKGFPRRAIYAATLAIPAALSLIMPFNVTGVRYTFICLIPMIMAMVSAAGSARRAENVYNGLYLTAIAIFVVWAPLTKLFLGDALFMPGAASNLFLILSQCVMLSQTYADALAKEQFLLADNAALERVNRLKTDLMNTIS
ncbi:MAG: 7TM-DISM domain-containing protein, partial [Peptococcaceae bacterium]|nr:7TM-DISM domain-containing protein [Peptococcaceae bacterium]